MKIRYYRFTVMLLVISLLSITACSNNKDLSEVFKDLGRDFAVANPSTAMFYRVDEQLNIEIDYTKLPYSSDEDRLKNYDTLKDTLHTLNKYKKSELEDVDKLNLEITKWYLENEIEGEKYFYHDYLLVHMFGLHIDLPSYILDTYELETIEDTQGYIVLLSQFEDIFNEIIEDSKQRETEGFIPPKRILNKVINQCRSFTKPYNTLYTTFKVKLNELKDIDNNERTELLRRAKDEIENSVVPAYKKLIAYTEELKKKSNINAGVWELPDGDKYYEYALKLHTTTDYTPEEIHQIGLNEVERIKEEIMETLKQTEEYKDLSFEKFIKLSPKTFSGEKAFDKYKLASDEMKTKLPLMFDIFPKGDVDIKPVPAFKNTGVNYYTPPSIDGSRNGTFFLNLGYSHRIQDILPLAYHETVPGHHFQIALEVENDNIPVIRKMMHFTGYNEGWALYAEKLAGEYGFYDNPIDKLGYLYSELYRAARLVVDTGIHYKKWTHSEAVNYLNQYRSYNTYNEIDRYIVWPGQACAYKIGEIKIVELRERAKKELVDKFDIKEFHRVVLENGSMPLVILEKYVDNYIESKK